jgi:hypothetical protein
MKHNSLSNVYSCVLEGKQYQVRLSPDEQEFLKEYWNNDFDLFMKNKLERIKGNPHLLPYQYVDQLNKARRRLLLIPGVFLGVGAISMLSSYGSSSLFGFIALTCVGGYLMALGSWSLIKNVREFLDIKKAVSFD